MNGASPGIDRRKAAAACLLVLAGVATLVWRLRQEPPQHAAASAQWVSVRIVAEPAATPRPSGLAAAAPAAPVVQPAPAPTIAVPARAAADAPARRPEAADSHLAPGLAAAPTAAQTAIAASSEALAFQQALQAHVARYRRYPAAAAAQRLGGRVRVVFVMSRSGALIDAWIADGSGSEILDRAALDIVLRAQPLPQIPAALPDQVSVVLPLDFSPPR